MVVSVFGGTVAFAGSAVATANSSSFAANVYAGGQDAQISITDTSEAGNDEKVEELKITVQSVAGDDGPSDMETVVLEETKMDSATFTGSIETEVVSSPDGFESDNDVIEGLAGHPITIAEEDYEASAVLDAEAGAPSITDADVIDMRDGNTVVRVNFSEPVYSPSADAFEFKGAGTVEWVTPDTGQDRYVELTFDREIQTGNDDSKLVVESSSYTDLAGVKNTGTTEYVDSVELNLDKGMNFVSAPFEAGGVGFSAMQEKGLLDNVDIVWAYDQSSSGDGHWMSYDPDADENELEYLYGGQGYVFVADKPDEIDLRSYTKLAADTGNEHDVPGSPRVEGIEPGWNLVGHYHEGMQPVKSPEGDEDAIGTFGFGYDTDVGVLGQMDDGSMDYVGEAHAGEAYWVFTRDYGLYTPKKVDGGSSTSEMSLTLDDTQLSGDDEYAENGETITVTVTASDADGLYSLMIGGSELGADSVYHHEPANDQYDAEFTVDVKDTEGKATIPVIAEDVYGEEKQVEAEVTLDTASPDVSNVQISDNTNDDGVVANDDSVQITAEVSDGASGVDSVSADASAFGAGTATLTDDGSTGDETADDGIYSATITVGSSGSVADGGQSVTVSAADVAGNGGSQAAASGTLPVDNVQPSASWSGYSDGDAISGEVDLESQTDLTTDSASTTTYEYSTDGTNWDEIDSPGSWDTSTLSDGDYTLRVTVEDSQNSASDTVSVTADNDQPTASQSDSFPSDDVTEAVDVSSWFDVDKDGGSATYAYQHADDSSWSTISDETSWDSTGVTDGDVDVRVTVDDGEGNSVEASGTVTVDNNEGSASVTDAPTDDVAGTATVSDWFDVSKDGGSASYEYGDAEQDSWSSISDASSWDSTNADDGSVDVRVTVDDGEGNTPTATATVTVDNNQPTPMWDNTNFEVSGESYDLTQDSSSTHSDSMSYAYSDDGGSSWNLLGDGTSWDTTLLTDGDVTVRATATDGQGNSNDAETTVTVNNELASASWADSFQNSEVTDSVDLTSHDTSTNADTTTYEVNDGSGFSEVSSTWDTTGLEDGDVQVRVTVTDAQSGEDSATTTVTIDNVQPSASQSENFPSSEVTDTVDVTSWFDVSKDGGTATYAYQHADDSSWTDITGTPSSFDTTGLSDGDVEFRVTVDDGEGNSATASGTVTVNNDQPTANWDNTNFEVSGSYDLTQDSTVENQDSTSYAYSTNDGTDWTTIDDGSSWDTTQLTDGDVTVRVTASDDQSSADAVTTTTVTVDNNEGSASVTNAPSDDVTGSSVDVSSWFDVDKDGGTATYDYQDAGGSWTPISDETSWDSTSATDGSVDVRVTVDDGEGNSPTATATVTVDNDQPTASWADSFQNSEVDGSVDLTTHDESTNADSTTYEVDDGSGFSEVSSTWDSSQVDDGDVTVRVTAEDNQGNSDSTTTTVTVNNVKPTASWDNTNFEVSGTYDLTADSSTTDADSESYAYSTDGGETWTDITDGSSWDTIQLEEGDVTVRVTAEDNQGSSDSATTTVTVNNDADPTMDSATGSDTSDTVTVTFSEGVYANSDGSSGDLTANDFNWIDGDQDDPSKSVDSVSHTAGDSTATLTLSSAVDTGDIDSDSVELANAVYDSAGQSITAGTSVKLSQS